MIPYKVKEIKNLEDVKREYKTFSPDLLEEKKVKEFIEEEFNILLEDEIEKLCYDAIDMDVAAKCRCAYFGITVRVLGKSEACDLYKVTEKQFDYHIRRRREEWEGYCVAVLNELNRVAEAKGVYDWLWAVDHINDQMIKWGWDTNDINTLIKRMIKAGYNPWALTADTAGEFIYRLPGHGFYEVTLENGKGSFNAYDPTGKREEQYRRRLQKKEQAQIVYE
ncbi:hypothetical protein [Methanosarcina mazei]|uniref:Uncharacterized protein n=1 Tax=Methanosarcina mazei TaxID=2209 RepID=A0A0F8L385_METMZ|nr:hypothetical protein [Methanosarcina mazei]KKG94573.1 hypothetical protein DU69_13910 [Methanosarcina mazei]